MTTTPPLRPPDSTEQPSEAPLLPLPELPRRRLRVRFNAEPSDWTVLDVGATYFSVSGCERKAGTEAVATFLCADPLTVSIPCLAQPATADGEQWFTVLAPETEIMALLRRLRV